MSQPGISLNQGMRIAKALLASYLLTGGLLLLLAAFYTGSGWMKGKCRSASY